MTDEECAQGATLSKFYTAVIAHLSSTLTSQQAATRRQYKHIQEILTVVSILLLLLSRSVGMTRTRAQDDRFAGVAVHQGVPRI